ncbi:MAG: putative sensor histidine kinase with multiple and a response regulator receiver domain [Chloroflexi bacterium]|nr:putative sensor histidine kinase with multiple and a response regulator receiver domain [Chloroflexota bacterium]
MDDVFAGGGEMGELMRSFDWSLTPLGPVAEWPLSVRLVVNICLTSRFPILLWWGPDLILQYNDAFRPVLGKLKHPRAMGQKGKETWPEIWPVIGPMLESVFATGKATWSDNQLLFHERNGFKEECYFTFSYSPIRDEHGLVSGIFTAVAETTEIVLGERRLKTLRDLSAQASQAKTTDDACRIAAAILNENRSDLPFSLLYLLSEDGRQAILVGLAGLNAGQATSPTLLSLEKPLEEKAIWPLAKVVTSGQTQLQKELKFPHNQFLILGQKVIPHSALVVPLRRPGEERLAGFLIAGLSPLLELDAAYSDFVERVAEGISTALTNVMAYEVERKRSEILAELDKAKTVFFNNISHEFRTPLTLMQGPLEDLLAQVATMPAAQMHDQLELIHHNSLRLLKLVNTLLDFSRIEAKRLQGNFIPTNLASYTTDLVSSFRSAVERAGLALIVDCPPLPQPVWVDRDMWENIVLNLLSNAFKFTFKGTIRVTFEATDNGVSLAVSDTGEGIPQNEQSQIFNRFQQVRHVRSRNYEGTGIGLAMVKELVSLHGGNIKVTSQVGQGSTFKVTLPWGNSNLPAAQLGESSSSQAMISHHQPYLEEALRWLPDKPDLPDQPMPEPGPVGQDFSNAPTLSAWQELYLPAHRFLILIVDDNADLRQYLRRLLGHHYNVILAADGASALRMLQQHNPDLILADVMMPGLDGFSLLKAVRQDPTTALTSVIMLSARAGEEARVEGLSAGADDYLVKPFSARELLVRVATHLKLTWMRREIARVAQNLAYALDAAGVGSYDLDLVTGIAKRNLRHDQLWGFTELQSQWSAEAALGNVIPQDKELFRERLDKAFNEGTGQFSLECRVRWPNNSIHWLYSTGRIFYNLQAQPVRMAGIVMDITERKEAEEQIRASEERFRRVTQATNDAIWEWNLVTNQVWWNEGVTTLFGYEPDQVGHDFSWFESLIHPSDRSKVITEVMAAIESGQSYWGGEYRFLHVDRSYKYVTDRGYILYSKPSDGGKPLPVRMVGAMADITRQKSEEAQTKFLIDFGEQLRPLRQEEVVFKQAANLLGKYLKVDRCYFAEINLATRQLTHHFDYRKSQKLESVAGTYNITGAQKMVREFKAGEPAIIHDVTKEQIPYRFYRNFYKGTRARSIMIVPLQDVPKGEVLLLVVAEYIRKPHEWKEDKVAMVKVALERVWLAAHNARLYKKASQVAILEERGRIARNLHDSLQQDLFGIQLQAKTLVTLLKRGYSSQLEEITTNHLEEILYQAGVSLAGLRALIFGLKSKLLTEQGLVGALGTYLESLKNNYQLKIVSSLGADPPLSNEVKEVLYWVAREAIFNTIKHARASEIEIHLSDFKTNPDFIQLLIKDNGGGFDPTKVGPGHFGLKSMKEQVQQHNGDINITSKVGQGTTILVTFPVQR